MPAALNVQGSTTYRPGVYGRVNASALAGKALSVGRVAIVGDFDFLERAKVKSVSSPTGLQDVEPTAAILGKVAQALYRPASDDRVTGGPSAVLLVSPNTTTQAQGVFADSGAVSALTLKARSWGPTGNRTRVVITANAVDATLRDFEFTRDGMSETFTGLGSGKVLDVTYTGTELTTANLAASKSTGVVVAATKTAIAAGAGYTPLQAAFDGAITGTPNTAPTGTETFSITVNGTNKATGLADSETLSWTGTDATAKTTTKTWSAVSSITSAKSGAAATATYILAWDAFNLTTAAYPNAQAVADRINTFTAQLFSVTVQSPKAQKILMSTIDTVVSASIKSATVTIRADLQAIVDGLKVSKLVDATRHANGVGPPAAAAETLLSGGTLDSSLVTADWEAALTALEAEDVQIVSCLSDESAVHAAVRAHCVKMAGSGKNERNAWVGAVANETKAQIVTRSKALNSRHVAIAAQEIETTEPDGVVRFQDPVWLALRFAGIQAGTPVATPLTGKYLDVVRTRENGWTPNGDANDMIRDGVVIVTTDRLGFRCERSVTTYLTDDNPVFSEVSANESINTSIRDLRQNLETKIGDPNLGKTAAVIKALVLSRLEQQVVDGIIKGFDKASVSVEDLGDRFRVNAAVAPVEPINFIEIELEARRLPAAA